MFKWLIKHYWKRKTGLCIGDLILQDRPDSYTHNLLCSVVTIDNNCLILRLEESRYPYTKGEQTYCWLNETTNGSFPKKHTPLTQEQRIIKKIKELDAKFEKRKSPK